MRHNKLETTGILRCAISVAVCLLAAGCASDSGMPDGGEASEAEISAVCPDATRVSGNRWDAGDHIFVQTTDEDGKRQGCYEYVAASAGTSTSFLPQGTGSKRIVLNPYKTYGILAFYPVAGLSEGEELRSHSWDITSQTDQKKIDFLGAYVASQSGVNTNVRLNFKHLLARVIIKLMPGEDVGIDDIKKMRYLIKGVNTRCKLSDNGTSMVADPKYAAVDWDLSYCPSAESTSSKTYTMLMVPSTSNLVITVVNGKESSSLKINSPRVAGESRTLEIKVNKSLDLVLQNPIGVDEWNGWEF